MRIFNYFWMLFAVYFILVQPALIYYNVYSSPLLEGRDPILALVYLSIAVIGWMTVLVYGWTMVYKYTYGLRNGIRRLVKTGKLVNAKIQTVKTKKTTTKFEDKEMVVSFANFSNTPITYTLILSDTKPHLNRYEKGKTIRLRADRELKHKPYVIPDDADPKLKFQKIMLIYGLWSIVCLGVIGYFIYAYSTESQGYGWRFLTWNHPLIMSLITLCGAILICLLINKLIFSKISSIKGKMATKLLFYGIQTTAQLSQASQTGTYINEQPEVRFELTFLDDKGASHQVSIKKVVSLINIQSVHQTARTIFYLPDSPTTIAFEEDLKA